MRSEKQRFHNVNDLPHGLSFQTTIMAKIKITQVKSVIDRSQKQKDTMRALGLRKINHSIVIENSPSIQGMVNKISHLVTVEEVN